MDDRRARRPGPVRTTTGRVPAPLRLPDGVRFAVWFSAWARGATSLDEARDRIVGEDAAHDVTGMPGREEPVPLVLALGLLRVEGATAAAVALPVPGDLVGLAGPPAFNAEALEAGEAVVLPGADLGLVPARTGAGVMWRALPSHAPPPLDLGEADTDLRAALPRAADALADLDVARWRPEVADRLTLLRRTGDLDLPADLSPRHQRVLGLAARCLDIVALASEDDGGAVSRFEADRRRDALRPLERAARRALAAAAAAPPR